MMDCPICAETFNNRNRKIVQCHYCFFQSCHECVGRFLLTKEEAECMNCHKVWGYDFLCTQMTKSYMNNQHKEHMKTLLMREVENGLGNYQEVAVLLNKKDEAYKKMTDTYTRLQSLRKELDDHLEMDVIFHGRVYKLCMRMDKKNTPEERYGALMINHIQGLVNPPPTEDDRMRADMEIKRLDKEKYRHRIMQMCALLNMNIFYTDKILIALSADILSMPLTEENKKKTIEKMKGMKQEYMKKTDELKQYYKKVLGRVEYHETDAEEELKDIKEKMDQCRKISRDFWKNYFLVYPPTEDDFKYIEDDKGYYMKMMDHCKQRLQKNKWDREGFQYNTIFNSNTRYVYNVDDHALYPLSEDADRDWQPVASILDMEEKKGLSFLQGCNDEIARLGPLDAALADEYLEVQRMIRKKYRQGSGGARFTRDCPTMGCVGKLGEDGHCGLCGRDFCRECMQERMEGHECKKEDVETVRELNKNTRPCPRCNIRIYKIEGCDQMWCVQCHTTFSWRTGSITHGVVHNPHFYDYHRQAQGFVQRAPGDIPCGGLPNEIEMLQATSKTNNFRMFDIWEYCQWLSDVHMPSIYRRFHNVRPLKYRRYSISYLRGKIDKKRLGVLLYKNYLDEIRYSRYYGILETFIDNMAEYMRQYVRGADNVNECFALVVLVNEEIVEIKNKYKMGFQKLPIFY